MVLGKQGAGKSTLLFSRLVPLCPAPCFILDTMGDVDYGLHFDSCRDLASYFTGSNNKSGVYVLRARNENEAECFFKVIEAISQNYTGEITVVVDEIDKFCSVWAINPILDRMIRYGRRDGVNFLFAARRTSEVHPQIRAQADAIISLRQDMPNDVKALRARTPDADMVTTLDVYKETGRESSFIVIGNLPEEFYSITQLSSYTLTRKSNESKTLS